MHSLSLVIPTKNRPQLLRRALDSITVQTHRPLEVLVIDDGSATSCADVAAEYPELKISVHRNEVSIGAGAARNLGAMKARGSLIGFLDDDDEYLPGVFERVLDFWQRPGQQVSLTWCAAEISSPAPPPGGEAANPWTVRFGDPDADARLVESQLLSVGVGFGVFVCANAFARVSGFDEQYKLVEDTDFFLRFLAGGHSVAPIDTVGVRLYQHAGDRLTNPDHNERRSRECVAMIWRNRRYLSRRPLLLSQLVRRTRRLTARRHADGLDTY